MPGEAYRDPQATADARIAQLEATADERGIALVFDRAPGPIITWARLGLLTAALAILFGILELRTLNNAVAVNASMLEWTLPRTNLGWFEPAPLDPDTPRSGPIAAVIDGKRVLVGLLWRRGERRAGLHVAAFDRATLAPLWVSSPIPADWISSDSDPRFHLHVDGDIVRLDDTTASAQYQLRLEDGRLLDQSELHATAHPFFQATVHERIVDTFEGRKVVADRAEGGLMLHTDAWSMMIPAAATASRLRAIWQDDGIIFVLVDEDLHAFNAANGVHLGVLGAP